MIQHDLMHWFTLKGQKASGTVSDKIMPTATCSHFPLSLLCTKDMSAFEDRFEDKFWQSLDSAWVLGCMILYVLNTSEYVSNKRFDLPQVTNFSFSPRILTLVSWTMSKTQARTVAWSFSHERMVWVPKGQPHDTSWKMSVCQSLHDSFIGIYNADQNRSIQYMFSWKPGRPRRPHHLHRAPRARNPFP